MKRVQLQLPDPVVDWIDAQADGIESRASFIRRSIVGLMRAEQRAEQRRLPINTSVPESSGDGSQRPGRAGQL
jgi:Arc/MetJ-type ribon-helix-helix transcriptional regulator